MIQKYLLILGIIISSLLGVAYILYKENQNKNGNENIDDNPSESLTSKLSLEQTENILGSDLIGENKDLIDGSIDSIDKSLDMVKNVSSGLTQLNIKSNFSLPEFLKDPTNNSLKIAKSDLELYNSKYRELSTKINNMTALTSKNLNMLSSNLNDLKKEVNIILSKFEELAKKLCLPIILAEDEFNSTAIDDSGDDNKEKNKIRRLTIFDEINRYKEIANNFFEDFQTIIINPVENIFEEIPEMIQEMPNSTNSIFSNTLAGYLEFDDLKDELNPDKLHTGLITTKKKFLLIKDESERQEYLLDKTIQKVKDFANNHKIDFSGFIKRKDDFFNNLKTIGGSIIDMIIEHKKEKNENNIDVLEFNVFFDISDDFISKIDRTFDIIIDYKEKTKSQIEEIIKLINVEEKTSLDLLFVMDITGSMGYYIEEAKENILEIINRIITECPGIDINLGFIGYRDIEELETGDYVDVNFTKNYTNVKEIIQNVYADGGGDTPEDVSWAMENALNKDWKNNARFLIFVADAPDHGREYHSSYLDDSYINGIPGRKNLTETIKELAENNVSLFCMSISYETQEMLQIFENVYKNYEKCEFLIVDMMNYETLFTDAVVNSATRVYESQRNVDIK